MAKEENEHKSLGLVILGIVAVIAVVGLVLLFVNHKGTTGEGIYGGAIKGYEYPNWIYRGTPANRPAPQLNYPVLEQDWSSSQVKDQSTNWNFNSIPKRSPMKIDSTIKKCNGGMLIAKNRISYYQGRSDLYTIDYNAYDEKAGYCVYPKGSMLQGTV